jgi:DNA-binding transcriptional ArsR family regulator
MPASNSSYLPAGRPPEVDKFVDRFLSLMCDRSRRQILELLADPLEQERTEHEMVECRSTDIAKQLGLTPATISGHLRQLADAKLVHSRKEGNEVYYRLANHKLVDVFRELLLALHHEHDSRLLTKDVVKEGRKDR